MKIMLNMPSTTDLVTTTQRALQKQYQTSTTLLNEDIKVGQRNSGAVKLLS